MAILEAEQHYAPAYEADPSILEGTPLLEHNLSAMPCLGFSLAKSQMSRKNKWALTTINGLMNDQSKHKY